MSSRSKRKRHRKGKTKSRSPDDYFAAGPFEVARFGRVMVSRSRASLEEWQQAQATGSTCRRFSGRRHSGERIVAGQVRAADRYVRTNGNDVVEYFGDLRDVVVGQGREILLEKRLGERLFVTQRALVGIEFFLVVGPPDFGRRRPWSIEVKVTLDSCAYRKSRPRPVH